MATAEVKALSDDKAKEGSPEGEEGTMTLWEHLEELRSRIVRMAIAFAIGAIVCWIYREQLLFWLTEPYCVAWKNAKLPGECSLNFGAPAALFISYVRLSALAGLIFALPIILYQVWAFIGPGLYSREKKFAIPFVVSSCGLFALGGWFGWKFAFPAAFTFLLDFSTKATGQSGDAANKLSGGAAVQPMVMIGDYIEFVTRMFIAFGATAELPILAVFLTVAGLITHRHLIKFFRYFIVVAFVIAAVLTPPDPMSQVMMAVPLIGLYGVSILIAWGITAAREKAAKEVPTE
ncbi:MAG: Twin-arginine translocation protein TatC [Polyangiaceae bacterium]|jgi:sec-independent protein translocase protein TatC|nr:Twin-arginine translocation protein TatC [Polyangiaceae bacterium]